MKNAYLFIAAFAVTFGVFNANATLGGMTGGGGLGVVCRTSVGSIKSVETLDLFEAREIYKLKVPTITGTLDSALINLKKKLKKSMEQPEVHLLPLIDNVQKITKFIDKDIALESTNDGAILAVPKNCKVEQLATYVDNELLLINKEYWSKLDTTNKVALILHEAIYKLDRYDGARNSRRTRKLVGYTLSDVVFDAIDTDVPSNAKRCISSDGKYKFYFYPFKTDQADKVEKTGTRLQFSRFNGQWLFSKSTAQVILSGEGWNKSLHRFPGLDKNLGKTLENSGAIAGGGLESKIEGNRSFVIKIQKISKKENAKNKYYISAEGETSNSELKDCNL